MKKGFTLIELSVAILVFSVVSACIFFLHRRSNAAFSITIWKQERAAQAERFWTHFRKHAEEATNLLVIPDTEIGKPSPEIKKKSDRPIRINSSIEAIDENSQAVLLSWNVSTLNFDFSDVHAHTSFSTTYALIKDKRQISLFNGTSKPIATLDDVSKIVIDAKAIIRPIKGASGSSPYEYTLGPSQPVPAGAETVGTLLEISLTMTPPKHSIGENNISIPQNYKFKLNVKSEETASP